MTDIPRRDFLRNTTERIQKAVERATSTLGGKKSADKRLKDRKKAAKSGMSPRSVEDHTD